jgi:hypothetical protein
MATDLIRLYVHGDEKTSAHHVDEFVSNLQLFIDSERMQVVKSDRPVDGTIFDVDICLVQERKMTRAGNYLKLHVDTNPSDAVNFCIYYITEQLISIAKNIQGLKHLNRYEKNGRTYCDKDCTKLHSFEDQPAYVSCGFKRWYQCGVLKRSEGPTMESVDGKKRMYIEIQHD